MNLSYWEIKSWLTNIDFTIVGSGIVGLNCALHLKQRFPKANILILEKGMLPQGASTKNAGFACFGSLSEIINDLKQHSAAEVVNLIRQRVEGLQLLRQTLGDQAINYQQYGGYELFLDEDESLYEICLKQLPKINTLLQPLFNATVFELKPNHFNFKNIQPQLIYNTFEGQLDTGKLMASLLQKVQGLGVKILNNCEVLHFEENSNSVEIKTKNFELSTKKLFITTNGFASQLLNEVIEPARAQVLITKPIKNLNIIGAFHFDEGYYYFRNIDNRILFGGGRNLDFKTETTTAFGETKRIQNTLEDLLKNTILPNINFEIDHRWSGIMGVGTRKQPIIKPIGNHSFCGVRLGGMGVAIGSLVGKALAKMA